MMSQRKQWQRKRRGARAGNFNDGQNQTNNTTMKTEIDSKMAGATPASAGGTPAFPSKTMVIYHSADFDGEFCHQIARKFLDGGKSTPHPGPLPGRGGEGEESARAAEVEYIGWDFEDAPLDTALLRAARLVIMDLPVDRPFGLQFKAGWICRGEEQVMPLDRWDSGNIVWIDHHKSSIESHPASIPGYRIDGVAACRLAWQWFSQRGVRSAECGIPLPDKAAFIERAVAEPLAVRLAGEYDVWDKRDPRAELFQHSLRSCDLSGYWPNLLRNDEETVAMLLERGEALQYAQTRQNESIIRNIGFTFRWEGFTWLGCNHARFNSLLFTAGVRPEHDALFGFKWTGKDWSVSLYHAPGKQHHDLSVIAKKYGGGGHRGACGFRTRELPFLAGTPAVGATPTDAGATPAFPQP